MNQVNPPYFLSPLFFLSFVLDSDFQRLQMHSRKVYKMMIASMRGTGSKCLCEDLFEATHLAC